MAQINKRNASIFSFLAFACSACLAHLVQPTLHAGGNLPCAFGATYLARWGQPTLHIWCNLPCTLGATYLAHWGQPTLHIYRLSDKPNITEYPAVSLTTARHFHPGSSLQPPVERKYDILSCVLPPLHGRTDICRPAASVLSRPHTSPVR